jgi:4-nitrophenyl phosphatase/NagD protein
MVGDRLSTDIALGAAGIKTILVLSGETKMEDLQSSRYQPDLIVANIAALLPYLAEIKKNQI